MRVKETKGKLTGKRMFWVEIAPSKWKLLSDLEEHSDSKVFSMHQENEYPDGTFKYNTHEHSDRNADKVPCIEDYACDAGKRYWSRYYVSKDGSRQGPLPFRSASERREYERLTGHIRYGPGERPPPTPSREIHQRSIDKKRKELRNLILESYRKGV